MRRHSHPRSRFSALVTTGAVALSLGLPAAPAWAAPDMQGLGLSPSGRYLAGRHAEQLGSGRDALSFYGAAMRDETFSTLDLQHRLYALCLTEGRLDGALDALNVISAADEKAPFSDLLRAQTAIKTGDYDKVAPLLADNETGLIRLLAALFEAWAKVGQKDLSGALKSLEPMKKHPPMEGVYHLHAALIEDIAGNREAASKHFEAHLNASRLSARTAELYGQHLERRGMTKEASELYAKYAEAGEGEPLLAPAKARIEKGERPPLAVSTAREGAGESLYNLAAILQTQLTDDQLAVLAHMALDLNPNLEDARLFVAQSLEGNGRYEEANAIYMAVPKTSALRWTSRLRLADNLDRMGDQDGAIALLRELAGERKDRALPLVQLGDILRRHDRMDEANVAYSDALERVGTIETQHWHILYARGITYERTKRWPKAEADFLKALELDGEQPMVLNYLGYSWIDQGKNLDRALDMIRKAVDLRPRSGYITDSLGWGLYRLGQFQEAVLKLERAIMLEPGDPVINDHLGDALWRVGRKREARFQWERALTMEPEPDLVATIEKKLTSGLPAPVQGKPDKK
ncbi:MAG: tetratricopeptide repeat protein [Alphaproteobacteria bacterium]|nr:tetratricopeptide repeat protein [Alphaproteobacteria bacterium]MBF0249866.1 tetratricopeptide repeat protein [Alphaproteobacteria bacterium]